MSEQRKIIFNGLNSLRAFGAIVVFINHIELLRKDFGFANYYNVPFFKNGGGDLGVTLFFVLSGFLITYLLLEEKTRFAGISLKKFYIRRILRIWPIYYLMIFIAFFIFPAVFENYPGKNFDHFWQKLLLCILIAPNFSLAFLGGIPGASHLWSIGVEEQFYLVWPWLIEKFYSKITLVLILIFLGISFVPHLSDWLFVHYFKNNNLAALHRHISAFFEGFRINSMALGALFAVMYFKKVNRLLKIFYHPAMEVSVFFVTGVLWVSGFTPHYFGTELYSLLFAIIIINVATNPKPIFSLKSRIMDFYGKISYGFYVYHWIIILPVFMVFSSLNIENHVSGALFNILAYTLPFAFTTLVSAISFFYFEKRILQLKNKFERVASGSA